MKPARGESMDRNTFRLKRFLLYGTVAFIVILMAAPSVTLAITLDECIDVALRQNPDIDIANRRIEAAEAKIKQAASAYYPWLTLSSSYTRTNNPPQAFMMSLNQKNLDMMSPGFDPNNPDDTDNIRTSLGFKYRLYDFGRREMDYRMARGGRFIAAEQRAALQNGMIHQVTAYFYGALQADAFVSVQEQSVESLQESLRVARERFKAGTAIKTDVLNLEVKLAQAQEDLIRAKNGVMLAVAALNTIIGKELLAVQDICHCETFDDIPALVEYEAADVERRPEMRMARIMADIGEDKLKKSKREYAPFLNAFGSLDWDSEDLNDSEESYLVGAQIEWDIFTGFYRYNSIADARAARDSARAERRKIRDNLVLDLKESYLIAVEARERLDVSYKIVESAEEALRITQERYRHKAADITDLLTAQVGATAIRTRAAAAYYDYLTALSNMERAKGTLVRRYAKTPSE
jgi:outer membrane protein